MFKRFRPIPALGLNQYSREIWILALGRLLSAIGTGFTLFYLPIFFVNKVGLSATTVGFGVSSAALTGVAGRFLGGLWVDSEGWGRRRTLFLSLFIAGLGALVLGISQNRWGLFGGNMLLGFGTGLYWPATETMVADLSKPDQRRQAYALTRLADSVGQGLGVIVGGLLISLAEVYRWLFIGDGISFWIFLGLVYVLLPETAAPGATGKPGWGAWKQAITDRRLLLYALVNCQITGYIALMINTLPLYLKNFADQGQGISELQISIFFTLNLIFSVLLQIPTAKFLQRYRYAQALGISLLFWGLGFAGVATASRLPGLTYPGTGLAMLLLAIATVSYTPVASALVVELAPHNLRGVYLSINSQCWAVGYFVGPAIGGIAMDLNQPWVDGFWLIMVTSIGLGFVLLRWLDRWMKSGPR
ncbi:MDR family MFS transporter [Lyngbya confervoides]|uniref:MFS transporter n=1 Tax=Lyngbya confervoides BDU141951 TaxID=1574623 RepID=A0ABD4T1E7_9CYAN|nr:MFS transporter [Lyngbya confervoides]MCM1982394.1 MFS transporter [Lyngbya confervoides BDU141951]